MLVTHRNAAIAAAIVLFGGTITVLGLSVAQSAEEVPLCRVTDVSATQGCSEILPPCAVEDSEGPCFWDAATRGNKTGRSFVAIPDMGVIPVA